MNNYSIIRHVIAVTILLFLNSILAIANEQCHHTDKDFKCVEYVDNYDGDTITVNIPGLHPLFGKEADVRLRGIDTPEIRTSDSCEKKKAREAKNYIAQLLAKAKNIELKNCERGKYFRIVCDVVIDGENASEIMLDQNLAVKYSSDKEINWCEF